MYEKQADMSNRKLGAQGTLVDATVNPLREVWSNLSAARNKINVANVNKPEDVSFWERWLPVAAEGVSLIPGLKL